MREQKPRWPRRFAPAFSGRHVGDAGSGAAASPPPPPAASVRAVSSGQAADATLPTRQTGDRLIVAFHSSGSMPAAQTGWTRIVNIAGSFSHLGVYTKISDGTDATPPVGVGAIGGGDFLTCYACVSIQNPATQVVGSTATTLTAPTVTAAAAGVLVSVFGAYDMGGTTLTKPAGQTLAGSKTWSGGGGSLVMSYETLAAAGATGTRTATPGGTYSELGSVSIAG